MLAFSSAGNALQNICSYYGTIIAKPARGKGYRSKDNKFKSNLRHPELKSPKGTVEDAGDLIREPAPD